MSRNPISSTGLIASPKKKVITRRIAIEFKLSKCAIAKPAQFSLRPFGGLFNPYSKSCSILCNHPAPNEVKDVVKQVKEQCIADNKGHMAKEDEHHDRRGITDLNVHDMVDSTHIPEEFFRRYTGSDSRPLTPAPTVVSGRTKTSAGSYHFQARRCFTPDPIKNSDHERKQIVLDLRRSHSQETLFWNASSELSPVHLVPESLSRSSKNDKIGLASNQHGKNMRLCEQKSAERKALQQQKEAETKSNTKTIVCINEIEQLEEDTNGGKRRGKKKKRKGNGNNYHMSQEPETQISAMGPDSPNASPRPASAKKDNIVARCTDTDGKKRYSVDVNSNFCSFLSEDALKTLRRGLNIDMVESAFARYMNKALMEALRTMSHETIETAETLRQRQINIGLPDVDNERWLPMPRKYTRNSARFTLPLNTQDLTVLTPIQYVSRHVWIAGHRKQLYHFVFNKFVTEPIDLHSDSLNKKSTNDDATPSETDKTFNFYHSRDRMMASKHLDTALNIVLGFHGTAVKINKIREILLLNNDDDISEFNFRAWSGIVAFAERFLNELPMDEDPTDEVEVADFESLERKFSYISVPEPLKFILNFLKYNTVSFH